MTFHELSVPPVDIAADDLFLTLGGPPPAALAEITVPHPRGGALLLGVLGASHVVTASGGSAHFTEQISCTEDPRRTPLPRRYDDGGYRLISETRDVDAGTLRRVARLLRARSEHSGTWITGGFPGDDAALTSLTAAPRGAGWHWTTWHLYPARGRGTVVRTESRWSP